MTEYALHISKAPYIGQYPDMPEFEKPWEGCIQVGQGQGALSSDKKPLQSEGFAKCVGLILKNESTLEAALFHIDDFGLNGKQTKVVESFMRDYFVSLGLDPQKEEGLYSALSDICMYYAPQMGREEFQKRMEELNREGIIKARFVGGTISGLFVRYGITRDLLGFLGIKILDDIKVDTAEAHWALVYKPKENIIYFNSKSQSKVLSFNF